MEHLSTLNKYFWEICFTSIAFMFFASSIKAQKIPIFRDPVVDSTYINLLPGKWSLRTFASSPYQAFSIRNKENQTVKYIPNNLLGVGLGFSYRFIVLDLGINIKSKDTNATSRLDLQMSILLQKHHMDFYFQTYKGFDLVKSPFGEEQFRDDIRSSALGINYYHNFNGKKLSLRSAFAGDQLQRKSSGTFALGGYFSFYKLHADSSIININNQPFFNEYSNIEENELFEWGVSGGYAYNIIFPKNLFFYSSVMPGVGINFGSIESSGQTYEPPIRPVVKVGLRASVGYAGKRAYGILSFISDYFLIDLGHENHYRYNPGKFKLVFGYRLQSKVKFLEKVNDQFHVD